MISQAPSPPGLDPRATTVRVLFLTANPSDMTRLAVGDEYREIDARLRSSDGRDRFELVYTPEVRADELGQALQRHAPNVVHFSGHGTQAGELVLPDARGEATPTPPAAVAEIFAILAPELGIRCVLLNACYSDALAQAIAAHVDCVIGTPSAIMDAAAVAFAGAFYEGLGYGRSVDAAYRLACCQVGLVVPEDAAPPNLHLRPGVDAKEVRLLAPVASATSSAAPVAPTRALEAAPRVVPPPGSGYEPAWYASRPKVEAMLRGCLDSPRSPAVVRSCRGMGRTWMLEHATRDLRADGDARVVVVQFALLDNTSDESILRSLADQIAEACGLPGAVDDVWKRPSPVPVRMQRLMSQMLSASPSRLVLVLDVPDDWLSHPSWSTFANMLRAWNDAGAQAPWDRLRLLLAWSTMPSAWGTDAGSPFRVQEVLVDDLDDDAIVDLARRHGLSWGAADVAQARSLIGGNPSLLRRLLYAEYQGASFADVEKASASDGGVFWEPDLRELAKLLRKAPELREAFERVADGTGAATRGEVLERLIAAGLVVRDANGARLRYRVYEVLPRLL